MDNTSISIAARNELATRLMYPDATIIFLNPHRYVVSVYVFKYAIPLLYISAGLNGRKR